LIDPGGGNTGGMGAGGECAGVTNRAEKQEGGKADIIFALDNSGSMFEEAIAVQVNMNTFSQLITDSQIDAHVVVISSGPPPPPASCAPDDWVCALGAIGSGVIALATGNGVCIDPPLGLPGACPDGDETNIPEGFMHWRQEVGSHDALAQIQNTFSGWQGMLRPDAAKTFVVVTDDDADPAPSVADFTNWANAQPVFASAVWRFSGVYCVTSGTNCANVGTAYTQLVNQTGGIQGDMANFQASTIDQEFRTVFDSLATAVIADAVPVECEWIIPPPPDGETLDPNKVNVRFTRGDGTTETIYGGTAAQCPAAGDYLGWYYDDPNLPTRVVACPETCPTLQADDQAQIDVEFGCDSEEPPVR
jgi:hypothetical protein